MNGQLRSPSAESPPSSRNARGAVSATSSWCSCAQIVAADLRAQVPGRVPVREPGAHAAFAADRRADPLVERRQIQHLFAAQRMADRAQPLRIDLGPGGQHVRGHLGVEQHPGHAAAAGVPLLKPLHVFVIPDRQVLGPEETPRADRHVAALGQRQAKRLGRLVRQAGRLADRGLRGRVQDDHAGGSPRGGVRFEQIGFDPDARLGLVADQLPDHARQAVFGHELDGRRLAPRVTPGPEELQPPPPQPSPLLLPRRQGGDRPARRVAQQRPQGRPVRRKPLRRTLDFRQPRHFANGRRGAAIVRPATAPAASVAARNRRREQRRGEPIVAPP